MAGETTGISKRSRRLVTGEPQDEYRREHQARSAAASEPDRSYIALGVAENKLVWDLLRPKMLECRDVPHSALGYDSFVGNTRFRGRLAGFMGSRFLGRPIDPNHVYALAGAGSVLEILFYAIADPGEGVLVPTPSYAGFWSDLETRDEVAIVPVHTSSADGFDLTVDRLDDALENAGRPVRALLFTTPNNPTGRVYTSTEIEAILEWAIPKGIHVVFDEIYALSVFGERAFVSCAELRAPLGEQVHIVWAFSKDFGASGLRCGVLISENEEIGRAVEGLAYWACVSGDTQHLLGEMISDTAWVDGYVAGMQERLREAYTRTTATLDEHGIGYFPAEGGFFFLCDLRPHLTSPTWEAEHALWRRILDETNVNLTPGSACRNGEPGFLRLCFAAEPTDRVVEGVGRIGRLLNGT